MERGDITTLHVDGIVNAANSSLRGGGGVDGAIHRAAGPKLKTECATLGGCSTGDARITKGYRLPAPWVIHTVGPVWRDGKHGEEELLADCHRRSLEIAMEKGLETLAFPAISTGAYGFPLRQAANIALRTTATFLAEHALPHEIYFILFTERDLSIWGEILDTMIKKQSKDQANDT